MRTNLLHKIFAFAFVVFAAIACQKELSGSFDNNTDTPVDLGSRVNASVSGFVTDENEAPVQNATVKLGTQTVTSNEFGFFEIDNEAVPKNAAMVTVSHAGYFPGIRTFIAKEGKGAFVRIKLLPRVTNGTISAANGGNVTLANGLKIELPENAVVNATSGAAYTGTINVAAQWIDPTAADLDRIMPGDLRAIDAENNMKLLLTYGMAAVDLTSGSGEKLQIATGKKATVTWPLPAAVSGSAPATIPLWHFDEAIGLWKEEGTATKTGNTYVGEVSHFSFWNCDVPNNYVQIDMTLKTPDNTPIQFARVKITDLATNQYATGFTDTAGYVSGAVPPNANLKIEIFSGYSCSTPLHSQTVNSPNNNFSLGTITVNNPASVANLTGNVTNCSGAPVTDGAIYVNSAGNYFRFPISNSGTFDISYFLCNGTSIVSEIIAEDYTALQQSALLNHTIVAGTNSLGTISACGTSSSQFLNMIVNGGTPENYTHPADSLTYFYNNQSGSSVNAMRAGTGSFESTGFNFNHSGITVGGNYVVTSFSSSVYGPPNSNLLTVNQSTSSVTITEYGAIGEFIAGNYTIDATGPAPGNTAYAITGSFRMRRNN